MPRATRRSPIPAPLNTDDIKHTIGHFAPGMVANPEAVPKCPRDVYLADNCPPETLIGSSEAIVHTLPPAGPVLTEPGRIYNVVQQGKEAGRLGIVVDAISKVFLEAAFYVRNTGDYGLDGDLDNLPRTIAGIGDIHILQLKFTLFGTVQGRNFTRGPTSCSLKVSTGEGEAYDHPGFVQGPADSYTPTLCDKLPFAPTFAMSVGDKNTVGERDKPPLNVTVTQKPGEAGILGNGVTLPFEIGPNLPAFKTICTLAQSAASACPPGSKMGSAIATSSFVDKPLTGSVYAVEQAGVAFLPGLVADLRGRVDAKIKIATQIIERQVHPLDGDRRSRPAGEQLHDVAQRRRRRPARVQVRPVLQERAVQVPDPEGRRHVQRAQRQAHRVERANRRQRLRARGHRVAAARRRTQGDAEADRGTSPGRRRTSRA